MERHKQWANMGEHAKKSLKIVEPYYEKAVKGGGYIVYGVVEKKIGGNKTMTIMSPIKKHNTEKAAIQHILAISQQKN